MAVKTEKVRSGWREINGIIALIFALLLFMGLVSYSPGDVVLLQDPPNQPPRNLVGPLGAWASFGLLMGLGLGAYLVPVMLLTAGLLALLKYEGNILQKGLWMLLCLLGVVCMAELLHELVAPAVKQLNIANPGGVIGHLVGQSLLMRFLGDLGTIILLVGAILLSIVSLFEIHPLVVFRHIGSGLAVAAAFTGRRIHHLLNRPGPEEDEEMELARSRRRLERAARDGALSTKAAAKSKPQPSPPEPEPEPASKPKTKSKLPKLGKKKSPEKEKAAPSVEIAETQTLPSVEGEFVLPPMSLLNEIPEDGDNLPKHSAEAGARLLVETLADFGVEAEVKKAEIGPVVTSYELLPAPGVRVEKISGLSNNIALAMKAESIRVQAPIPGKGVVGIEIPNKSGAIVYFRQILESAAWKKKRALPLVLGMDVSGHELVSDLTDMPHLLIAGATGSGKSVCMNSLLAGLLMSRTPDQLRLMLVDPKIVEFTAFHDLPHLVAPVISDPKKVSLGLRWAINEMEKRYKLFAKVGVRNIKSFNSRKITQQQDLFDNNKAESAEEDKIPETLPYIVIVIDELADLMMVAQADVENAIARLAQLSRAVGIHMILATQRPSVNVITGTIKANFPARIAFQVAQKVDSRTILDANGADKLLGKGDMLFLPPGSAKLLRAQGAFTSDEEIYRIVDYIKQQGKPEYETAIKEKLESKAAVLPDQEEDDELLEGAIEVVRQTRRASTSSLQRRLRIGYNRAARLMDLMEEKGIVGPPQGSDPREILIDLDGEIPQNVAEVEE